MRRFFHVLLSAVLLLSLANSSAEEELPACDTGIEKQFYNAYVDVLNLPPACDTSKSLIDIGFIIQDAFEEVDFAMRGFHEERVQTKPCPFPDVILDEDFDSTARSTRRYQATGRGDRCKSSTTLRELEGLNDRLLQEEKEICAFAKEAESDSTRAEEAVTKAELVLQGIKKINGVLGSSRSAKLVDKAQNKMSGCKSQRDRASRAHGLTDAWCKVASRGGLKSSRLKKAQKQSENARECADKAEKNMFQMLKYENELVEDLHDAESDLLIGIANTPSEQAASKVLPESSLTPMQQEYLDRLQSNIDSSNTECQEVASAMFQKTLAEEAVRASHLVYDEILEIASTYDGNVEVERVKAKAANLRSLVEEKAGWASVAADLASDLCLEADDPSKRKLEGTNEALLQETETANTAAVESRMALLEQKRTVQEMEEVQGLIEFEEDAFYQSLAPEVSSVPPLYYTVRSGDVDNVLPVREPGLSRTKAEWFEAFGNMLVSDIYTRIFLGYNSRMGGCVTIGSGLAVVVNITELQTVWDEFVPAECSTAFLARDPQEPLVIADEEPATQPSNEPPDSLPPGEGAANGDDPEGTAAADKKQTANAAKGAACSADDVCSCATSTPISGVCFVTPTGNCCGNEDACICSANDSVGELSCNEEKSCQCNTGKIGTGTGFCTDCSHCIGEKSCRFNAGNIGVCNESITGSCSGGGDACFGEDSCQCNSGDIAIGACTGEWSCTSNSGFIDQESCTGEGACSNNSGTIGQGSCKGENACANNQGIIGEGVCNDDDDCSNCGNGGSCS